MIHVRRSVLLYLLLANFSAATYAAPHVSVAARTDNPNIVFSGGEQANAVQAAQVALANCRKAPTSQSETPPTGVCELTRVDDTAVTTKACSIQRGGTIARRRLVRIDRVLG